MMTDLVRPACISIFAVTLLACSPAKGQGIDAEESVEAIVGSEIKEEQTHASADAERVIAAIDKTEENTSAVRKVTQLDRVEIVFLPDAAQTEGGPPPEIERKIEERKESIEALRQEIEGNAMLYHALNSRQILMRDVLAIEFDDANGVTIYAAAKPTQ